MLLSDLLTLVRQRIQDPSAGDFLDPELIGYYNNASDYISNYLISIGNSADMITEISVPDGTTIPTDFSKLCGKYPMHQSVGVWRIDATGPLTVRYWAMKSHLVNTTDTIPFRDICSNALIQLTAIYAENRNRDFGDSDQALITDTLAKLGTAIKG